MVHYQLCLSKDRIELPIVLCDSKLYFVFEFCRLLGNFKKYLELSSELSMSPLTTKFVETRFTYLGIFSQ